MRLLLSLTLAVPLFSADIYFASSSAGSNNGTNCANAYNVARFNTNDSNWTAGNTLHLCGTFTGSAGATVLTTQASGSSGSPITILFETGSIVEAPYLNGTNGGIFVNGHSYITIDGGSNGIVRNTANGTALANQQVSRGVHSTGSDNLIVKNLTITNLYIRTENSTDTVDTIALGNRNSSNVTFTNNVISYARMAILATNNQASTTETGIVISFNTLTFTSTFIAPSAVGTGGVLDDVKIFNNDFGGGAYLWDEPSNDWHHDGIHFFQSGTGTVTGVQVYNNYFHGIWSRDTAYGGSHITAPIYMETVGTGPLIFNNVFDMRTTLNMPSNGYIYCKTTNNCRIYNNTFHGEDDAGNRKGTAIQINATGAGADVQNNIFHKIASPMYVPPGATVTTSNRNVFYDADSAEGWGNLGSFASWQGLGFDANSVQTDPLLSLTTYLISSGSPAINLGADLTSVGVTALNSDRAAVARGTGNWDAGAYEFGVGGGWQRPRDLYGHCWHTDYYIISRVAFQPSHVNRIPYEKASISNHFCIRARPGVRPVDWR